MWFVSIVFFSIFELIIATNDVVLQNGQDLEIVVGQSVNIEFIVRNHSTTPLNQTTLYLSSSAAEYLTYPPQIRLENWTAHLPLTALRPASSVLLEISNCSTIFQPLCPLDLKDGFVRISVIRSHFMSFLCQLVGWIYFFAWSISFYPQIRLNYQRKSVIGLNFDFLALNLLGFAAYSIYNLLMFFNSHVKQIYSFENPHSPPPVLTNDVVFAVHAFFACAVTVVQCLIYEREETQIVSKKCIILIISLIAFGFCSAAATVLNKISILAFVTSLSYIKMAVTCSKYFPQAYYNFARQSTIGWSIGNILLDFTGGTLDILQMVFQAINVNDWTAFYANPVKFGLGLVSIIFDVVFIVQHYVLYRETDTPNNYGSIEEDSSIAPIISDA